MALRVILKLSNAEGTSITMNNTTLAAVMEEFHNALAEQRLMDVGMNNPEYAHRVNPHMVVLIQTLDY